MSHPHPRLAEKFRRGGWLPANREVLEKWHKSKVEKTKKRQATFLPPIQELKEMIENDGDMYMAFNRMFENPTLVKDYKQLLELMNDILTEAPFYGDLGPPFYMILAGPMNTDAGFTAFLADKLNAQFKKNLRHMDGLPRFPSICSRPQRRSRWLIFRCDPSHPQWGFTSWDDFFVRQFNDNIRCVELPEEHNVISAACESVFYNKQENVQLMDEFWIKGEPYSLQHMLNHDKDYGHLFTGGSVFQGFLQVTGYHRWHSPVDGKIMKIVTVPGTYFVQSPALLNSTSDHNPYLQSLAFITAMTTRMLIFIESSNPAIGLMCFIAIGMTEVSTGNALGVIERGDFHGVRIDWWWVWICQLVDAN
ncbi:hypothetical protein CPC08DRAFT_719890 [Agrocybe pediades]|nr:hypothetical protein CPC08DRAFT_719890 [Agrocybe pediades]